MFVQETLTQQKRILVVEDDPSARESIALILKIDRHHVTEAPDGKTALELVQRQPFDLVVLDFAMPGILGAEVARHIKQVAPTTPILMVTAYLEKLSDADKPVDAVLAKPFAVAEFRQTVAALLSRTGP